MTFEDRQEAWYQCEYKAFGLCFTRVKNSETSRVNIGKLWWYCIMSEEYER